MTKKQPLFEAKKVVTGYDKKIIIDGIDITIPSNKISVIIGANACGKSTLLKTLARLIKPVSGDIVIDGKKITSIPSKQLAQVLGLLPQSPIVPEGITVWDLVSRGRYPYQSFLKSMDKTDFNAINIIRTIAKNIQGGGGGQPFYATAGGKNKEGLDKALQEAEQIIIQFTQ